MNDPFLDSLDPISKVVLSYFITMSQKLEDKEAPVAHILNKTSNIGLSIMSNDP